MNKDWFNLKEGWIVSKCIPVVPLGLDLTYPAELQNLCEGAEEEEQSRADSDKCLLATRFISSP